MAVPAFLTGDLIHQGSTSMSDVQDIIDDFGTLAVTLSPAWTDEGGGLFTSPVDGDGRFLDILFTRIDADTLQVRLRDDTATQIMERRIQIVSGPQDWWMTITQFMVWIEIENAVEEAFGAGILDLSPDTQTSHSQYVWGRANRDNAGTADASGDQTADFFMLDNGSPVSARRSIAHDRDSGIGSVVMLTGGGSDRWNPLDMRANFSGQIRYAGRAFQMLFGTTAGLAITIPVGDAAETGVFRESGLVPDNLFRVVIRIG